MKISEVMTRDLEYVDVDDSLQSTARLMRRRNIGFVPVVEHSTIVGLVTDRDIAVRAVAEGLSPTMTRVQQIMTPRIWFIYENQEVREAAQLMREKKVRRLIVLDDQDRPVGVISLGDLAAHGHEPQATEETLEVISQPAHPAYPSQSELEQRGEVG